MGRDDVPGVLAGNPDHERDVLHRPDLVQRLGPLRVLDLNCSPVEHCVTESRSSGWRRARDRHEALLGFLASSADPRRFVCH